MSLEEHIREIVAEAVKEAFEKSLAEHLTAIRAAHEPSRLLAEAMAGGDDEELTILRRVNSMAYLDAQDVAKLLGISRHTVYQLVRAGELPATRIGRRQIVRRTDIDAMMGRHDHLVGEVMSRDARRSFKKRSRVGL